MAEESQQDAENQSEENFAGEASDAIVETGTQNHLALLLQDCTQKNFSGLLISLETSIELIFHLNLTAL